MEADLDRDARITPAEYDLWRRGNPGEHESFGAADANLDGVLTFDEWPALSRRPVPPAGGAAAGASAARR